MYCYKKREEENAIYVKLEIWTGLQILYKCSHLKGACKCYCAWLDYFARGPQACNALLQLQKFLNLEEQTTCSSSIIVDDIMV